MITFAKVKESILEGLKRTFKVEQFGVKTATESMPFGFDGSPLKDMTAIYSNTSNDAESVIIGYINKNQIAEAGESRIYSLDSDGILKAFVYCKKDGVIELNGNTNFVVKYNELQTVLNALASSINTENGKIATAIGLLGGSYVPAPITIDISSAKNETIKTN